MGSVIGGGTGRFLIDETGDPIDSANRLPVETEQDDAFASWVTYPDFAAETGTSQALNHANHTGASIETAKEILIQTDDANSGFIMVGSSQGTTVAGNAGSRQGVKLNAGETLILAISTFADIFIIGSASTQYVQVAYFA